jgi:hypothetical protein
MKTKREKFTETANMYEEWTKSSAVKSLENMVRNAERMTRELKEVKDNKDKNFQSKYDDMMRLVRNFNNNLPEVSTIMEYIITKTQADTLRRVDKFDSEQ